MEQSAEPAAATEEHLIARLQDLEERVKSLEAAGAPTHAGTVAGVLEPKEADDTDRFWALTGLQERATAPGAVLFTGTVTLPTGEHYVWQQGQAADTLLDADWTQRSAALVALAHPVRLLLLREVLRGARTVAQLGAHEQLGTTGQLYHHLRHLVSAGWLRTSARGQYMVPGERVIPLLVVLTASVDL
jgi:hypothetical protein